MNLVFLANLLESFTISTGFMLNKAYTTDDHSSDLLIALIFPWMHFAAGPILPMAQYIIALWNRMISIISNNNFNLPATKFAPLPTDFDTVGVNNRGVAVT